MRLGRAAKFGLAVAVEDDPVDVAVLGAGFPAVGARGVEADEASRAGRIVRVEQRLDRSRAFEGTGDAGGDAVAGHVRQFLVHELRGVRAALALEASVEPLLRDAFEL